MVLRHGLIIEQHRGFQLRTSPNDSLTSREDKSPYRNNFQTSLNVPPITTMDSHVQWTKSSKEETHWFCASVFTRKNVGQPKFGKTHITFPNLQQPPSTLSKPSSDTVPVKFPIQHSTETCSRAKMEFFFITSRIGSTMESISLTMRNLFIWRTTLSDTIRHFWRVWPESWHSFSIILRPAQFQKSSVRSAVQIR